MGGHRTASSRLLVAVSRICQAAGGFKLIAMLHLYFPQKVGTFDIQFL